MTKVAVKCLTLAVLLMSSARAQQLTPEQQKAADMRMPKLDRSELQPEKRKPTEVTESERNPFGLIGVPGAPAGAAPTAAAPETEEQKLRRILRNMRISGVSGAPGSYRVLLGSMSVREGDILPRLFSDQAEILRVKSITEREIVLAFVEKDDGRPPRTLGLGINIRPDVRSIMLGDTFTNLVSFDAQGMPNVDPMSSAGVESYLKGVEDQGKQSIVDRSFKLMGDTAAKPPDEKKQARPE